MSAAAARAPVIAYVALGANLGEAAAVVASAIDALNRLPDTRLEARSHLYRSAPVDAQGPDFINAVAAVSTRLTAPDLLLALQQLEQRAGRERPYRNAPRTLDLDLLRYGEGQIHSATLTVPHPRMAQRAFVLRPLAEIAPRLVTAEALAAVAAQAIERLP